MVCDTSNDISLATVRNIANKALELFKENNG